MQKFSKYLNQIFIIILLFVVFIPFYVMIVGGLKSNFALMQIPPDILPFKLILDNFKTLIFEVKIFNNLLNSLIISSSTVIITVFVSSCAGYVFAKKNFPGKNILFFLLIATMMIPRQITMVPTFIILRNLGLIDNYLGLILPAAAAPFAVFLLKQFMQTIPNELIDAAKIDGASEIRTFTRIIIPISKAPIAVVSIFTFVASWNDYFWQLIIISSTSKRPLPLALAFLLQEHRVVFGQRLAGAALGVIPIIIIFIIFQRYFTKGITVGAIKG